MNWLTIILFSWINKIKNLKNKENKFDELDFYLFL
jgi:hypothetical protein